jgi:hypothetical protein
VRRIAISGLVALAAVLGGVAVPTVAMAQPTAAVHPTAGVRADNLAAMRTARTALAADEGVQVGTGEPLISCVLATDCLGVKGSSSQSESGSTPTRIARWNGSSWKGVGAALPKGTKSVDLNGVSCKGGKSCLVVGDYYTSTSDSAVGHPLALIYNGTSLKPTATVPIPKGTADVTLTSVSCATTRYCVALGAPADGTGAFSSNNDSVIIIETWNGAKWTLHTAAGSMGKTTTLEPSVVSCATTAFCVLGGEAISVTSNSGSEKLYVASWNGKKLTTMKAATLGGATDLPLVTGVSCATASNCAVTGADLGDLSGSTASLTAFTEVWNGKTWQLAKVAWPKGIRESLMFSVSCYAAHSCEAVGIDAASTADTAPADAAAVSFNGATGTLQSVPAPSKGHSNAFTAVSCLPWGSCVAAGETGKTNADSGAAMTGVRNGNTWKLDPGL